MSVVRDQTTSGGHVPPTALVNSTISGADSVSTQWAGNNVGEGTTGPTPDLSSEIDEAVADDGTSWIRSPGTPLGGTGRCHFGLNSTIGANVGSWRIAYRALRDSSGSGPSTFRYTLYRSDGLGEHSPVISTNDLTTSWATYTTTINFVGGGVADNANSISITVTAGGNNRVQISRLEVIG